MVDIIYTTDRISLYIYYYTLNKIPFRGRHLFFSFIGAHRKRKIGGSRENRVAKGVYATSATLSYVLSKYFLNFLLLF
jgi:hypothetical protein